MGQQSPFLNSLTQRVANPTQIQQGPKAATMVGPTTALGRAQFGGKARSNPFLTANSNDSEYIRDNYGINRPLDKAMFLGYHNDQPMYGGGKLFLLY